MLGLGKANCVAAFFTEGTLIEPLLLGTLIFPALAPVLFGILKLDLPPDSFGAVAFGAFGLFGILPAPPLEPVEAL